MKGQAFDTFKLMIAAVVAVAILGILLGILRGLTPTITDPLSATQQLVRDAYTGGISKRYPNPVVFTADSEYPLSSLIKGSGIPEKYVALCCETDKEDIDCSGGSVVVGSSDINVKIKVDCATPDDSYNNCSATGTKYIASGVTPDNLRCTIIYEYA